jgi:signal transduction histidine kinase/CheY-like chemotaxis protein
LLSRYYQPIRLGLTRANTRKDQSSPRQARASPDRALTAFAQLATLRLNCKRSIISFFDRNNQYILAEATQSLSLQTESEHAADDHINYGVMTAPKRGSICEYTTNLPFNDSDQTKDESVFMVPDLSKDERFSHKAYTAEHGWRFYAGVPIVSPNGYKIGAYCVIDDQPRKRLAPDEIAFMKDMATTVMIHLDMLRSQSESIKGERMVHGLGCFVEGKHSLGDWEATGADLEARDFHQDWPLRWAERQYSRHHDQPPDIQRIGQRDFPSLTDVGISLDRDESSSKRASYVPDSSPQQPSTEEDPKAKKTSPTDLLAPEVKATFGRAANIIRESLHIEAVVIFDATAKSTFGGLVDGTTHERPKRRRESSASEIDSNESGTEEFDSNNKERLENEDDAKRSEILGISLPTMNSAHGDQSAKLFDGMTEGFVRSLLRRYPHGKVLNFDEDADLSLGDDESRSETMDGLASTKSSIRKRKRLRSNEAKIIKQLFPGVRSFAIQPMWSSDQKFFSACIAWTLDPHRILTTHSELSYLAAFCDCTMSEVARLNAKIADKAKSDFISSISHELRSPLHGILGSVECLEDSTLDPFQENLVHTLATCGHTLLDTIDHLLDFAKINNFTRKSTQARTNSSNPHEQKQNFALDVDVDLSVVTEEVLETVFAGHDFIRAGRETEQMPRANKQVDGDAKSSLGEKNVSVVVDISKAQDSHWIFRTQAGAWRRILSNLFNNSLKYTSSGFIQVKLDSEPLPSKERGGSSKVTLSVTDSGKGMTKEYLDKSLFTPFAQEDPLQPGTGLGLAIISAIIKSMGGTIEVESEEGKGTKTTVVLELMHIAVKEEHVDRSVITSCANRTKGMKIGFIGFDADSYKKEPQPGIRSPENATHRFMASFHRMCQNWFGMDMQISQGIDQSGVDVFLTTEKGLEQVQDQLEERMGNKSDKDAQNELADIPLLVICNSVSAANAMMHHPRSHVTGVLSQPCGPRKLAKSLTLCLEAHKNTKTNKPMPSVRKVLDDSLGEGQHLQDTSFQKVLQSEDHAMSEQAKEKGHTGDAPLKHPQEDTVEIAQGTSRMPKTDTSLLDKTSSPTSPAPSAGSSGPMSRSNSGTDKPVRKVLLVDDNRVNLQLLVTYVKKSGHYFKTASDGLEALEAYKAECDNSQANSDNDKNDMQDPPFDYVLMDLSMPVMDGLTSTRKIRAHEKANDIKPAKVIALTGLASAQAQQEAYSSGVDTFMTKPVKLKELGKMLDDGTLGNEETKEDKQMGEQKEKEKKIENDKK